MLKVEIQALVEAETLWQPVKQALLQPKREEKSNKKSPLMPRAWEAVEVWLTSKAFHLPLILVTLVM